VNIVCVGEVLWDVFDQAEHLGGAALNFAAHAHVLGHNVSFISAIGEDKRGERVLIRMKELGLSTKYIHKVKEHETGIVTVNLDSQGQPHFVLHRPAAYDFPELSSPDLDDLKSQKPDCIYYGTLFQMSQQAKALTLTLLESFPGARRFYDVNLRVDNYTPSLVRELMGRATVVKLNDQEASAVQAMFGQPHHSLEKFCRRVAADFDLEAVCVTRGAEGCALLSGNDYIEAPGFRVQVADTVGAGDAFAAAFVHGLSCRWSPAQIADFANRVGALVASRNGGTPPWSLDEAMTLS
jgi:fructokinase